MNEQLEIMPAGQRAMEVAAPAKPVPSVAEILAAVVERGVTEQNVNAVKEVVALYERMEAKAAERAFATAFVALQAEMKSVQAVRAVPNNDGTIRYAFAPFEEIMATVKPLLEKHGFTVTFSTDYAESRIIKECILTHVGGHSRSNKFAARVGKGPPGASDTQADGAASTYAKRFALCDALAIVIERDSDARAEGDKITPEQVEELSRRVALTNSDRAAFLKFAGADKFEDIRASKYAILDEHLQRKERRGR